MTQDDMYGPDPAEDGMGQDLEPLASQVISMLCERQTTSASGARQVIIDYLVRAVTHVGTSGFDASMVMEELRGYRLTVDTIIDLYIPQVANRLGEMWMMSDLDFASVTVGSLRLQSLLGEASLGLVHTSPPEADCLHALIVVPEQEQHFLGASVVAAQLRRLGCDVSLSIAELPRQVTDRVVHDQPDMVLVSCARVDTLESITQTIRKIKTVADPVPVLALGGAMRGDIDGIRKKTGVDLVTKSAKDVVGFCVKRRKALGSG